MGDAANADAAAARAEYQRKQRDRKRLYRARLKDDMASMRAQVSALEAKYEALYAAKVQQKHTPEPFSMDTNQQQQQQQLGSSAPGAAVVSTELQLQQRYAAAKEEMAALRSQMEATKQKLSDFDLFTASLECYLGEFQMASSASSSPPPSSASSSASSSPAKSQSASSPSTSTRPPRLQNQRMHSSLLPQLSEAACQEIIKDVYQESIKRKWTGRSVGTGAEMLGWTDQRFVDGSTLQFALSKSFPNLGKEYLMQKTWDILTTARHMRTLQRSTTEVTILQRVSDDIIILERRVKHEQLHRISCVQLLIFRIRTETGYIVAYKAVNPPGSPQESSASSPGSSSSSSGPSPWGDPKAKENGNTSSSTSKPKLAWVDTMQWFVFDDLPIDNLDYDVNSGGSRGCQVLIGGRTAKRDDTYANFFLFEVVTYIIRWESAVAGARLLLS